MREGIGCLVWIVLGALIVGGIWGCEELKSASDGSAPIPASMTVAPTTTSRSTTTTTFTFATRMTLPPTTAQVQDISQQTVGDDPFRCLDCGYRWEEDWERAAEDWYEYGSECDDEWSETDEVPDWWFEEWVPCCPDCGSEDVEMLW